MVFFSLAMLLTAAAEARPKAKGRKSPWGLLEISSMTEGAEVFVDGNPVGTIPLKSPLRLGVGKHTLKIVKKGFTEYLDVFSITRAQKTELEIDLLPYAGVLDLSANVKEASVYIDGKYSGTTPLELELLIGKRTVRLKAPGYDDALKQIHSVAGKRQSLALVLKPLPLMEPASSSPAIAAPPKWYERWYVWAGAASLVSALTVAIVVPVVLSNQDPTDDFCQPCDFRWQTSR
jgi:hypothetical protein